MGSKRIRKRKPGDRLPSLSAKVRHIDEPPVMWPAPGSGFEADPFSPAGTMQRLWRFGGGGSDANEAEAQARQRPIGRVGALVLRLLGYRPGSKKSGGAGP